jgi:hypothetical protein
LHPALQRDLFAKLVGAFPNTQFICATHSPFIATALPDSDVHVLSYNQAGKVESTRLDLASRAGSANDILREVLGMPITIPLWAEERLEAVISRFTESDLSEGGLVALRAELAELGLEEFLPEALTRLLNAK